MKGDESFRVGDYEVHRAWEGFSSIRQISSGEIMHSRTEPMEEARRLYVEQARLGERLREISTEPLILWDVGLGAAANAMAAIESYENAEPRRRLQIISFENDLDSLRLAAAHLTSFPYLRAELLNAVTKSFFSATAFSRNTANFSGDWISAETRPGRSESTSSECQRSDGAPARRAFSCSAGPPGRLLCDHQFHARAAASWRARHS